MIILVRNIDRSITEDEVLRLLKKHGKVRSFDLVRDKVADTSKGFGFADMPSLEQATQAIEALDGYQLGTRKLRVKKAASSSLLKESPKKKKGKSYGKNPFKERRERPD
ncbi:RNA recognition motif domain-containing protein [Luteolibacter marinus]|uniref:RNA recognition motif domain-containing protein n=1 Tax=Luteolibacter marinus TaxID=2776705 RepID=UPI001867AEB6|nr:RNA-binding protein [Luteolibacter marinus]